MPTRTSNLPEIVAIAADGSPITIKTGIPYSAIVDMPRSVRDVFEDDFVLLTDRFQDPAIIQSLSSFKVDSPLADIRKFGADPTGQQTIADALNRAIDSGAKDIWLPPGCSFLLDNPNGTGEYPIHIPAGVNLLVDALCTSTAGKTLSWEIEGDSFLRGGGMFRLSQGYQYQFLRVKGGTVRISGLRFKGISSSDTFTAIALVDTGSGEVSLTVDNCVADSFLSRFVFREGVAVSNQQVGRVIIANNRINTIWNGSAINWNDVSGKGRDLLIAGNVIQGVIGNNSGDDFEGAAISVAGYSVYPMDRDACNRGVLIAFNDISTVRTGVHVELCRDAKIAGNTIRGISRTNYPAGSEANGIVVWESYGINIAGNTVTDVQGDSLLAQGIRIGGGFDVSGYASAPREISVRDNTLNNASFFLEMQVKSGGAGAYELTDGSILHFRGNTVARGFADLFVHGQVYVVSNTIVAPLSAGPLTVTGRSRSASVATLTLAIPGAVNIYADPGIRVGQRINVQGVGSGFDAQDVTVTAVSIGAVGSGVATISYSNAGSNVSQTTSTGSLRLLRKALRINADEAYSGQANFTSKNRLQLRLTGNVAEDVLGVTSAEIINVAGTRLAANVSVEGSGNNFSLATSITPLIPLARKGATTASTPPKAVEYVVGDEITCGLAGSVSRKVCTTPGWVATASDPFTVHDAVNGIIKQTGITDWVNNPASYRHGQPITLTGGSGTAKVRVIKAESSGGNSFLYVVDIATGLPFDLTGIGSSGTIAPTDVAAFSNA